MAKSFGEVLAKGVPIVFLRKGDVPEVICEPGKEAEALDTMEKMNLIKVVRPRQAKQPPGTIKTYDEFRDLTDEELLEEEGWTIDCQSPYEISHKDGSRASGRAAIEMVAALRAEFIAGRT